MMNIVLFGYRRPEHIRRVLLSIVNNECKEKHLFCYVDGEDTENVVVCDIIKSFKDDFASLELNRAGKRLGLRAAVEGGLNNFFSQHYEGTILEDDIVVSPHYLQYMEDGLSIYRNDKRVFSISSFMQPFLSGEPDTFLLPRGSSWGWSTWADRWKLYDADVDVRLIKRLASRFDFGKMEFSKAFDDRPLWAIRWYYTQFKHHGLSLFPTYSMSANLGMDGTGDNRDDRGFIQSIYNLPMEVSLKKSLDLYRYAEYLEKNIL